jgi:hypothetical protein
VAYEEDDHVDVPLKCWSWGCFWNNRTNTIILAWFLEEYIPQLAQAQFGFFNKVSISFVYISA